MPMRRIFAEDPEWHLTLVRKLSDICVDTLVTHFESNTADLDALETPNLEKIPEKYLSRVLSTVSTEIPLAVAATAIPDMTSNEPQELNYWRRRAMKHFSHCDPSKHGNSWKQLYFERHVAKLLEFHIPNDQDNQAEYMSKAMQLSTNNETGEETKVDFYNLEKLTADLKTAGPFVRKLNLHQIRPMLDQFLDHLKTTADHMDLYIVFKNLPNLEELSLFYGVKDCGFNFHWKLFGMTIADCESLASCLLESTVMVTLKKLNIQSSGIDDIRMRMLCRVLTENSCLESVDVSHNNIGKGGARGIAKVLASPKSRIAHFYLSNNRIGRDGIISISKALSMEHGKNTHLKTLDVALNDLTDEGCATLFEDLIQNSTLEVLDVSANNLGQESALAMAKYIRTHHSDGLQTISASCNKFADKVDINAKSSEEIGKLLLDCMNMNKRVIHFDIRQTDVSSEIQASIRSILSENRLSKKKHAIIKSLEALNVESVLQ